MLAISPDMAALCASIGRLSARRSGMADFLSRSERAMRVGSIPVVPTIAAIAAIALTVSLGNWQSRRAIEKAALQEQRDRANAGPAIDVGPQSVTAALVDRRVALTGRFLADRTVFLDNRTHAGKAGAHVITPLQVDGGGPVVLVLRGWIALDPAHRAAPPALTTPAGTVRLEGIAQDALPQAMLLGSDAPAGPDERIWQRFGIDRYRQWSGLAVAELIVRQTSELPDGLARDWIQPGPDVAKHRGYAIQWYGMAALVAATWIGFVVVRPRWRGGRR
jgi:surfeit locus 1 family protein